jgi:hypothetical protein
MSQRIFINYTGEDDELSAGRPFVLSRSKPTFFTSEKRVQERRVSTMGWLGRDDFGFRDDCAMGLISNLMVPLRRHWPRPDIPLGGAIPRRGVSTAHQERSVLI